MWFWMLLGCCVFRAIVGPSGYSWPPAGGSRDAFRPDGPPGGTRFQSFWPRRAASKHIICHDVRCKRVPVISVSRRAQRGETLNFPNAGYPIPPSPLQPQTPARQSNTVGLVALALSIIIGFVFACIPGALIVGWVLLPAAFILSIVGLCLSGKSKGRSIAAVIISIIGVIAGFVVFFAVVGNAQYY